MSRAQNLKLSVRQFLQRSRRWWLLALVVACAGFIVFVFNQPKPLGVLYEDLLGDAVIFGMFALLILIYDVFSPALHEHVTCVLLFLGATGASICCAFLGHHVWSERTSEIGSGGLPFMVGLTLVVAGVAGLAWWCFFNQVRSAWRERNMGKSKNRCPQNSSSTTDGHR